MIAVEKEEDGRDVPISINIRRCRVPRHQRAPRYSPFIPLNFCHFDGYLGYAFLPTAI